MTTNTEIIIPLDIEEAEAFYASGIGNSCPFKYFTSERKIWWVIQDANDKFPYTLCQDCYHSNSEKVYNDKPIKDKLKSVMLMNILCCCDGVTDMQGFPINLGNGWLLGIYTLRPKISIVNADYIYVNCVHDNVQQNRLLIDVPFVHDLCDFMLNFKIHNIDIDWLISCDIIESNTNYRAAATEVGFPDGDHNIRLFGAEAHSSHYKFSFNKNDNVKISRKFTLKIRTRPRKDNGNDEKLLFDIDIYLRHITEQCGFSKNVDEGYIPASVAI